MAPGCAGVIAHVDMDAFYASVEAADHPEWAGRPLVVGGGKRGVVSAASYEARAHGVRSAMPMFQARRLCPRAVFVPVRMERYRQVSRVVMDTLRRFSPLVEPISVDEAFVDLAGTERLWGPAPQAGRAIKAAMAESTGLTCSVGIAPLRFLAKIASERDKPDGLTVVEELEAFLQTVLLKEISGVGPRAQGRLAELGLRRLVDVRALGAERLERVLGSLGRRLWELAHGIDPVGVGTGREVKSLSHELTFSQDLHKGRELAAHLLALCQKVARRLRAAGLAGHTVTLKLKHADHRTVTRRRRLKGPTDRTETIHAAARELLAAYGSVGPFRLIGVGVSGLNSTNRGPGELFAPAGGFRAGALETAEDELTRRFGSQAITRAGTLEASRPGGAQKRVTGARDGPPRGEGR